MEVYGDTFASIYAQIREYFLLHIPNPFVREVGPRGLLTHEVTPVHIGIANPRSRLGWHEKRKYNLPFAVADSLLIHVPETRLQYFTWANKKMADFSDDDKTLHGAYGPRVCDNLEYVLAKLIEDPDTRQAVINIYESDDGLFLQTKSVPCTTTLQFMVREQKLQLHVHMRSNDLIWGLFYDVFVWTLLQEVMANALGIEVGPYYHTANSLHIYERHFKLLEEVDSLDPVEFAYPYGIDGIRRAAAVYQYLVEGGDPFHEGLMLDDADPLIRILLFYACHKKMYTARTIVPVWAEQFMAQYDVKEAA